MKKDAQLSISTTKHEINAVNYQETASLFNIENNLNLMILLVLRENEKAQYHIYYF